MQKKMGLIIFTILGVFLLAACGGTASTTTEKVEPAKAEAVEGRDEKLVTLTERAAERLAIETAPIEASGSQMTVPYGAVVYDLVGATWVYVNTEPLTFIREPITVVTIDGDTAILSDGPEVGTEVLTVGVAEVYGVDTGVGK